MKKAYAYLLLILMISCQPKLKEDEYLIENLLKQNPEVFGSILDDLEKYEVQIIYTQINRDSSNTPQFKSFYFNVDAQRYFYPASTVKMPIAFLALEKLNELNIEELDRNTTFLTDSAFSGQTAVMADSTAKNGLPSIAHYIKKIFVVSDNDAYNRLYEFLGQEYINRKLQEKGFGSTRIIHRLSIPLSIEENQHTNPVRFVTGDSLVYSQPLIKSSAAYNPKTQLLKGKEHVNTQDNLVQEPFNFTYKNFMPLEEMQKMLCEVLLTADPVFDLTEEDRSFLFQYMSQLPRETAYPKYDTVEYQDAYSKFLMFGDDKIMPDHIRIFNKIGQAYGYLTDNAYIVDFEHNIEFLLSAVIHVNENETYNDGNYEYEQVAFPFMRNLGQTIHKYEITRKRERGPDLTKFKISYDK